MRAFVTGGTGFLGSRVVSRLLARGDDVVALAREGAAADALAGRGVEVVHGDLGDTEPWLPRAAECDVVYHVGARVLSSGPWEEFWRVNVEATQRLMDASLAGKARRFVHVSSLGIFDIDRDGLEIGDESDYDRRPMLRGHYTRSKLDADRLASTAVRVGRPVVVVRPGVLYGPKPSGQGIFLGRVKKFLRPDLLAVVSSPDYRVPLVYVENAADAVVLAGTAEGIERGIFNVIDDPDLTQQRYFRTLSDVRPRPLRVVYLPVSLISPVVRAADFAHRLARRRPWTVAYQLLRSERSARYSTEAARSRLGWTPAVDLRTSLQESLKAAA
ncbi:MAG TPA: NAD-dependent epimerase/dehydratase family protein [Candidatus Binatia bacterium]|jgi:nucleoside-diphosphate-sugar epimerase